MKWRLTAQYFTFDDINLMAVDAILTTRSRFTNNDGDKMFWHQFNAIIFYMFLCFLVCWQFRECICKQGERRPFQYVSGDMHFSTVIKRIWIFFRSHIKLLMYSLKADIIFLTQLSIYTTVGQTVLHMYKQLTQSRCRVNIL